ncbi:hypothetical protein [Microbulbifer sp. VAAF005]|uniref:hypothetical protein n=1 Tax=Microbulbifer sp. VAAF005 TaxID=3034230 RepID=UPI0024AD102B|nr:hypothetical protein [Microbulbifer sp. VAAF005]WHI48001.1 hypothetical protein P0078_06355 [Microbulbifer sp. VAAF005]
MTTTELTQDGWELTRLEGGIPGIGTGHQLDVLFKNFNPNTGVEEYKAVEMKIWDSARSISGSTYDQFEAYITGGSPFEYYFSDHISDAMKGQFQNVFKDTTKASNLFALNPGFFMSHEIATPQMLVDLANQGQLINHPTFINFVH